MTGPTDSYKVVVVGDGGTGKSTFIRKLVTAQFATQYDPTVSCEVVPVDLETSAGPVRFFCWDTAGQEKFGALRDGYYDKADAAIVFFDVTSRATQKSVGVWITDILRVCGSGLPIVICANKVDLDNRRSKYTLQSMKVPKEAIDDCELIETSVLNGHNILEPLHFIVKAVLGGATLTMPASQGEPGPANSTPLSGKRDTRRTLLKRATDTPLPDGEG